MNISKVYGYNDEGSDYESDSDSDSDYSPGSDTDTDYSTDTDTDTDTDSDFDYEDDEWKNDNPLLSLPYSDDESEQVPPFQSQVPPFQSQVPPFQSQVPPFQSPMTYLTKVVMDGRLTHLWELLDWGFEIGVNEVYVKHGTVRSGGQVSPWKLKFSNRPTSLASNGIKIDYQTVITIDGTSNYLWQLIDFGYETGVNQVYKLQDVNRPNGPNGYTSPWKSGFA